MTQLLITISKKNNIFAFHERQNFNIINTMSQPSSQFKALWEVTNLLDGYKLRNIDVLANIDSKSNFTKYYHFLKNDETKNEDLAAQHIGYTGKEDPNYRRFRVDYKTKLLHTIFFIDTSNTQFKEQSRVFLQCSQHINELEILIRFGFHDSIAIYAREILEQTQRYELTELSLKLTIMLRQLYALHLKSKKEYERFATLSKIFEYELQIERKALEYFDHLMSFYIKRLNKQDKVYNLADSYYRDLTPQIKEKASTNLLVYYFSIGLTKYLSRLDYQSALEICDKAISTIKNKKYNAESSNVIFRNNKILCLTKLKQYDLARLASKEALNTMLEGHNNWFSTVYKTVNLAFHESDILGAFEMYETGRFHKNFNSLPKSSQENWYLLEAYMSLFEKLGALPVGSVDFKLKRFINNTPMMHADKEGRNTSVQIIRLLHKIVDNDEKNLHESIETLVRYRTRYMKSKDHKRTNIFVNILKNVIEAGHDFETVKKLTDELYEQLKFEEFDFDNKEHLLEVVPFHILWVDHGTAIYSKYKNVA